MDMTIHRLREDMLSRDLARDTPSQGADYRTMRGYNHLLVLNCIRLQGPVARVAIAQQTGLSKTTVSSIIDQLLQDELVIEGDFLDSSSTGGRRAILVHFHSDLALILGIDVGYSHLTLVATNLNGEVKTVHIEAFDLTKPYAACMSLLFSSIRVFLAKSDIELDHVVGIGIGMPGSIDVRTRTFIRPPKAQGWENVDIPALFMEEFHIPTYIDTNANLGALSEGRYGVGKGISEFAYVSIGSEIGCGQVRNWQIFHGSNGAAGEMGHIHVEDGGPVCVCGRQGCLETFANSQAIIDDACQGHSLARLSVRQRTTPMLAQYDEVDMNDVIHAASAGDMAARTALAAAGHRIGTAIATLILLVNPQAIILDGYVIRLGHFLLSALKETAEKKTIPAIWAKTDILIGQMGDLAVALGAATLVIDAAFSPINLSPESSSTFTSVFP